MFLDVDGCLLDFAATPEGVVVERSLHVLLEDVARRLDGALALVSGRSLDQLDHLFAPTCLPMAGLHGLQRRNGELHGPTPIDGGVLAGICVEARLLASKYPGALIEDKGVSLALHWRAEPLAASDLQAFAMAALQRLPGYRLQPGDHVIELQPAMSDKGAAIAAFLQEPPFRGRMPAFAGDDFTDEYGFSMVNAHDGISVIVGAREPTAARYRLKDSADVRRWLQTGTGL